MTETSERTSELYKHADTVPHRAAILTPRDTLAATLVLGTGALALFALHLAHRSPLGYIGTVLWCCWLGALGSTAFLLTFLRATHTTLAEDWRVGYALGDLNRLPLGDPALDQLFGAQPPTPGYARASLWPLFGAAGALCWGCAAAVTVTTGAGWVQPRMADLATGLTILMAAAVQCSAAALNGPTLTRQYTVRHIAGLAHRRLRAESDKLAAARALAEADPGKLAALALVADDLAHAAEAERCPPPLKIVPDLGLNGHSLHGQRPASGH